MTGSLPNHCKIEGVAPRRTAPFLLIFALGAIVLFCLLPLWPRLTIADWHTNKTLNLLPIQKGESFQIRFTHSLNLSDVTDTIEWTGETLLCRSTLFSTYGAGIPDLPDGIGKELLATEDGFLLTGIDKPETHIPIMLQSVPNHRLIYRGKETSLLALYGSGTLIDLSVQRVSLADCILYERSWR